MTLREIKLHFSVYKLEDGGLVLYDESQKGKLIGIKYVGTIYQVGKNKYTLQGNLPFRTIDELKEQLKVYAESLPYDVEYYNPSFRNGYKEELIVAHELKKMGYNLSSGWGVEQATFVHDALTKPISFVWDSKYDKLTYHVEDWTWIKYPLNSFEDVISTARYLIIEAIKEQDKEFQSLKDQFGV